jgi:NAD(P)H-dependent nitrite reductase small subunit
MSGNNKPGDQTTNWEKVCITDDVPDESGHVVTVDGEEIAIFEIDGEYYAINNVCPHQGGPLGEGVCEGTTVYCPWHGYEFDLETGTNVDQFSDLSTTTYDVKVEGDDVYVQTV